MYTFSNETSNDDRNFFGYNWGYPMRRPNSSGILSDHNIMTQICTEVGKTVPYFKEYSSDLFNHSKNMSEYLANKQK